MGKHGKLTSIVLLVIYVPLAFYVTYLSIYYFEVDELNDVMQEMTELLNFSYTQLVLIMAALGTLIIIVSTLVQFFIDKFLLIIFARKNKNSAKLFLVLLPKIFIAIINIIFIVVGEIHVYWFC